MITRVAVGSLLCLVASACNTLDESAEPTEYYPPAPVALAPGFGPVSSANVVSSGALELQAELAGELRGIELNGRTTENFGSYELWDDGGGYLQFSVAGPGDSGAGMLIVSMTDQSLGEGLLGGHWSSADTPTLGYAYGSSTGVVVSSCAGPTVGEWPWEIGAVDYDMTAEEDPEVPDTVVLRVVGQFPLSESDASGRTRELAGTIRFERFDQ
jgi:hypothetical protein